MSVENLSQEHQGERAVRLGKIEKMRDWGIPPFASKFARTHKISEIFEKFGGIENLRDSAELVADPRTDAAVAGRVVLQRSHGKIGFLRLLDQSGEIQVMVNKANCAILVGGERLTEIPGAEMTAFKFVEKMIDVGDWIGVRGEVFRTHKGELTIFAAEFEFLSKAVRPLGDKRHGVQDQDLLYRHRYLDMIHRDETKKRMIFRADFIRAMREFYRKEGFLEIDCPVLTPAASGAAARPFATHHNDFDREFFLRICNEIELKKATVGGLENVFTIAVNFRNEGSDPSHLQEFTMMEHQRCFVDFREDMDFVEKMFDFLFERLELDRKIPVKNKLGEEKICDFTTPWPRIDYVAGVNEASGLDITKYGIEDAEKLRADIRAKGFEFEGMEKMGTMTLIDYLYKKVLRPSIVGPAFVRNYPSIIAPLARVSDEDSTKCEKWQVVVNGWEVVNAYWELVDPVQQRANFAEQAKAEAGGDEEATSGDSDFVVAMEYGMPIQSGIGIGIERLLAILTQQENLRDVVMFPLMKPLGED